MSIASAVFLSYYPLKQGLKPDKVAKSECFHQPFLSYYPLKQGLKRNTGAVILNIGNNIFILLSIKTRIETGKC